MTAARSRLIRLRLRNEKLCHSTARTAAEVVSWLGAVQSQDYAGARWAVGQRMARATDAGVGRAFDAGEILRTHVLRPTWHFVAPADVRWLLALSAPRVHAFNAPYYRRNELDRPTFARTRKVLERALRDGRFLTRAELAAAFARTGIKAAGERLAYITMHAELDGVICSGPRRGNQFTYALLHERAPRAKRLAPDEALAELTRRYLQSHGPATARDFAWWSGFTLGQARHGVASLGREVAQETCDGLTYSRLRTSPRAADSLDGVWLLPNYDEFLIAYQDRGLCVAGDSASQMGIRGRDAFIHHLVIDGRLAGSWRPVATRGSIAVEVATYDNPTARVKRAVDVAVAGYSKFLERPAVTSLRR